MSVFVTGGAGFIGSNFVLDWLGQCDEPVINLDALTYAGNLENLARLQGDARHTFIRGDIGNAGLVSSLLAEYGPEHERRIAGEDPAIGIQWPLDGAPALFAKDQQGKPLAAAKHFA